MESGKRKYEELYSSSSSQEKENEEQIQTVGKLKDLKSFLAAGVVKLGQQCSVERTIARRTNGLLYYTLQSENDEIMLQPRGETLPLKGQPVLQEVYGNWFPETGFYQAIPPSERRAAKFTGHLYKCVRFYYTMRKHPSCTITVPISDLEFIQKSIQEWEPVMSPSVPMTMSPPVPHPQKPAFGLRIVNFGEKGLDHHMLKPMEGSNTVELPDKSIYGLELSNPHDEYAAASVNIDGKYQGDFLLEPHQTLILQRPAHDARCFLLQRTPSSCSSLVVVAFSLRKQTRGNNILVRARKNYTMDLKPPINGGSTFLSQPSSQLVQERITIGFDPASTVCEVVHLTLAKDPMEHDSVVPLTSCTNIPTKKQRL